MDALGGQVNAFTAKECTCYYAKVIACVNPIFQETNLQALF